MKNRVIRFSSVLALLGVLGGKLVVCRPHELGCETAVQTVPDEIAIIACQREYERTQLPATGAALANLLYQNREPVAAWALAYGLLGTEARSDALQILGQIAVAVNRCDDAERALQGARRLHLAKNRHAEASRDLRALAESYAKRDRFAEALEALEECLSEARLAADARAEGECHLAATRILVRVGHFAEARKEIDLAKRRLSSDRDLARLSYEQGYLEQESVRDPAGAPHHEQAVAFFETALERGSQTSRSRSSSPRPTRSPSWGESTRPSDTSRKRSSWIAMESTRSRARNFPRGSRIAGETSSAHHPSTSDCTSGASNPAMIASAFV